MSTPELYAQPETVRAADLNDLADLLKSQRARALDVVAPPSAVRSRDGQLVVKGTEPVITDEGVDTTEGTYGLTRTAEAGLAGKLDIPQSYIRHMRESGRFDLYDRNVNGWLHGQTIVRGGQREVLAAGYDKNLLLRILRGDDTGRGYVRAVLSDGYRIIDNLDVLSSTLDGIRQAGIDAQVRQCDLSEKRMYVKVWAPEVAALAPALLQGYRSPFDGGALRVGSGGWSLEDARTAAAGEGMGYAPGAEPVVFAGFVISNSEVGQGQFTIAPQLVVKICRNGLTLTADAMSRRHVGTRLDEGEIKWSDATHQRNLELIKSKTTDAVRQFLSPEYVRGKVAELEREAGAPVAEPKETVALVAKRLQFTDREADSILEHFLMGAQRTAGGVMQAVSSVAQTIDDADRATELEAVAVQAMALAAVRH